MPASVDWEAARATYRPTEFAIDGFVHCSFRDQVAATATTVDRHRTDLVLLCIDEEGLEMRVEDCYETGVEFPHVYQPIPVAAVTAAIPFPCRPDGSFHLPRGVPD